MPLRIRVPVCEVCGKRLTPNRTYIYYSYRQGALDKVSKFCCGELSKNDIQYDSIAFLLRYTLHKWNSMRSNKTNFPTRVRYAIERTAASCWVSLILAGNYTNSHYNDVTLTSNEDGTYTVTYTDSSKFDRRVSVTGRLVRMVRKIIAPEFISELTDEDFETFHNVFTAAMTVADFNWDIVSGEEIRRWYHENTYAKDCGILSSSCMRYRHCQSYFDLYVNNPNQIQMLIAVSKEDQKLHGRALLWRCNSGQTFLDRPYGTDIMIRRFTDYGTEQGWAVYPNPPATYIQLENTEATEYPYLDTFMYLDGDRLRTHDDEPDAKVLQDTDGGYTDVYGEGDWTYYDE